MGDYFSRAEFLEGVDDHRGERYTPQAIDAAQAEVIERLERWSGSAWPNVGVEIGTGTMANGTDDLVLTSGQFDEAWVGREVVVLGGGAAGADLVTTITAVTDPTHATLTASALTAVLAVPGNVVFGDGDGTARLPRSITETYDGGVQHLLLGHQPVISVASLTISGSLLDADAFDLYGDRGTVAFDTALQEGRRVAVVTYTYGHTSCPWSIKRPAITAAKSLLASTGGRGRIPPNVREYRSEGTTLLLRDDERDKGPWPWDRDASDDVARYWSPPIEVSSV